MRLSPSSADPSTRDTTGAVHRSARLHGLSADFAVIRSQPYIALVADRVVRQSGAAPPLAPTAVCRKRPVAVTRQTNYYQFQAKHAPSARTRSKPIWGLPNCEQALFAFRHERAASRARVVLFRS